MFGYYLQCYWYWNCASSKTVVPMDLIRYLQQEILHQTVNLLPYSVVYIYVVVVVEVKGLLDDL
jgi:hypothetical protein